MILFLALLGTALAGPATARSYFAHGDEATAFAARAADRPAAGATWYRAQTERSLGRRSASDGPATPNTRMIQMYGDARVLGGSVYVENDAARASGVVFDNVKPTNDVRVSRVDAARSALSRLSDKTGADLAEHFAAEDIAEDAKAVRLYVDPVEQVFFYRVVLPTRSEVWLDADTGALIKEFDATPTLVSRLLEADVAAMSKARSAPAAEAEAAAEPEARGGLSIGYGIDHLGRVVTVEDVYTEVEGGYVLSKDEGRRRQLNHDFLNRAGDGFLADLFGGLDQIQFQLMIANGNYGPLFMDEDNIWDLQGQESPAQDAAVSVATYTDSVMEYFMERFDVDYLELLGVEHLRAFLHVGKTFFNAFYLGEGQMGYGDGDPAFSREVVGASVIIHELSHGVTDATSELIYMDESGALNEAMSDIVIPEYQRWRSEPEETWWLVGEEVMTASLYESGILALRNMANPTDHESPAHYFDKFRGPEDNGGVHINSGIPALVMYLAVNGGSNPDPEYASEVGVTATMPLEAATDVFVNTFVSLTENASFCNFRENALWRAQFVETRAENAYVAALEQAFDEVGLTQRVCNYVMGDRE